MGRGTTWFLVGAVAATVAFGATPASAHDQYYSATHCTSAEAYPLQDQTDGWASPYGGIYNYSTYGSVAYCPIDDDDYFPKSLVNYFRVDVEDDSTTDKITAWACVSYYPSNGSICGSPADTGSNGNTGIYYLNPGLSIWQSSSYTGGFPYLEVYLPAGVAPAGTSPGGALIGYITVS